MTNAETVFTLAVALMDELSRTGLADTADTRPYRLRTLPILNVLRAECARASANWQGEDGARPMPPPVEDFSADLGLDDGVAQTVLPYGLAAHLLLDENPAVAAYFAARYEELLASFARALPRRFEDIERLYGGTELSGFSVWR